MTFLLDVNVLLAALWGSHQHHSRFHAWAQTSPGDFATCAIVELGCLRVLNAVYGAPLSDAKHLLHGFKNAPMITYWMDAESPVILLPPWVSKHSQTTDGYLCALAKLRGAKLATFDMGIKDATAFLIP